ncbi:MAG: hypothetical protein PHH01_04545 [Patescibacteria group bacterium]|nr:hypothetical protein [Patescibacteria group bacterium]
MNFAKEMLDAQKGLQKFGYEAFVPPDTHDCVENPNLNTDEDHCDNIDIMRSCMKIQEKCDALLVLNYLKHNIEGYLGVHTLMELGLAYYLKQRIFLLYPVLPKDQVRSTMEVMHMKPTILKGDIENIKQYL